MYRKMGLIETSSHFAVNSEFKPIKAVLLYRPGPEVEKTDNPLEVLYIKRIKYAAINKEYDKLIEIFNRLNIRVYLIKPGGNSVKDKRYLFNMMYTRDLFFITPAGVIISRMASDIRKGEVRYAQRAVRNLNIPVLKKIDGNGTFEGADALWINSNLVMIGTGNRTNEEGFQQINSVLRDRDTECISVPAPRSVLHLQGAVQFIDADLALVRTDLVSNEITSILRYNKINVIKIPEINEVRAKYAMNIIATAPREIIMPADCSETKKIYLSHGIKIIAEPEIEQLKNGGGGISCAAAVIAREL